MAANYPKASETDKVVKLWGNNKHEYDLTTLPEKFIVVTANQTSADVIIDKLEASE